MVAHTPGLVIRILILVAASFFMSSVLFAQRELPDSKFGLFTVNFSKHTTFEPVDGGGGLGVSYQHRFFRHFAAEIDLGFDFYLYEDEFNINFPTSNQVEGKVFLPQGSLSASYVLPFGSLGSAFFVGAGIGCYNYSANASYVELMHEQVAPNQWQLKSSIDLKQKRIEGSLRPYWLVQMGADISFGEMKLQTAGVFIRYNAIKYLKPMDTLSELPAWQLMPGPKDVDMSGLEFGVNLRFWLYGKNQ